MTEATYLLPVPPSTNNLFASKGSKRVRTDGYNSWRNEALAMLVHQQRARPFPTPCIVTINVSETGSKADIDNLTKPVLDLLVTAGVIPNDTKEHVRRVSIGWEPIAGCTVHLQITDPRPAAAATGRRGSRQDRTSLGRASPPSIQNMDQS